MPRVREDVTQAQAKSSKRVSKIHSDITRAANLTGLVLSFCGTGELVVVGPTPVVMANLD